MRLSRIHDIKPSKHNETAYTPSRREVSSSRSVQSPLRERYSHVRSPRSREHRGRGVWYLAGVLLIGLVFGFSIFFAEASVEVTPKSQEISVQEQISAFKKSVAPGLRFDSMIVSGTESVTLTSETKQFVEVPATGRVRIYNQDPSKESQSLRIDTRLVDERGVVYKTKEPVVVPAMSLVNGVEIAGSVEVEVYADVSGEEGNREETDIKLGILGFKESGSDKFETVYAHTITPLSGGFVGERFVVDETQQEKEVQALATELQQSLVLQAEAQMPDTVIAPENLQTLFDVSVTTTNSDQGEVVLTLSGSLFSVLFNRVELEHYIVENILVGVSPESVRIVNIDTLAFSYIDPASQTVNPPLLEDLLLTLSDTLQVEFVVHKDALAFDLVGKKRKEFNTVIANHAGVSSAVLSLTPFWKSRLPERDEDININIDSAW